MFDSRSDLVQLGIWLTAISAVLFVAGLVLVPWMAVRLPADYLVRREPEPRFFRRRTPLRWIGFIAKNVAGALLVVAGVVMLGIPGPGWGAIIVGLTLMSFPGKRRLERRLLSARFVIKPLNAIRAKAGKPPLEVRPIHRQEKSS
jgi:uncharacterized membrane protein SpoIIM required for sporulation